MTAEPEKHPLRDTGMLLLFVGGFLLVVHLGLPAVYAVIGGSVLAVAVLAVIYRRRRTVRVAKVAPSTLGLPVAETLGIRRTIPAALVGAILGALLTYTIFQPGRYVIINANPPIKLDRWTGRTWQQSTGLWVETRQVNRSP